MLRRRVRLKLLLTISVALVLFAFFTLRLPQKNHDDGSEQHAPRLIPSHTRRVTSLPELVHHHPLSVLLPDWTVLLVSYRHRHSRRLFSCLFQNNATSPASFSGALPSGNNAVAFKCSMPISVRRLRPFLMPLLLISGADDDNEDHRSFPSPELYRWTYLVYDSFSTEHDVVLFVKGLNRRQGADRSPEDFACVFFPSGAAAASVRTAVTSSSQEVFRCKPPPEDSSGILLSPIGVSLEVITSSEGNLAVPSVARYAPRRILAGGKEKRLLCAATMVYGAAKFVREWVMYHSAIGVEEFFLYDNDSDDDVKDVVSELNDEGFEVTAIYWAWPKTQEAGFSHAAVYAKDRCDWMMFVDVDEFVFSPSWAHSPSPSPRMLKSLLRPRGDRRIGQLSIRCNDFGPSNQRVHPKEGVTQGYTCRRRIGGEQRHKSIVLLEAVEESLVNAVHHFKLRGEYATVSAWGEEVVINHYKYQAWPEFRNKFRRRVSAYVVDWTRRSNMASKDRTPGLGSDPIEPRGWETKFCDVTDDRLKNITRDWFGTATPRGYQMAWQR